MFIRGPNGELIEVDEHGRPIRIKGENGKNYIRGPNGELIEVDENGNPIIVKGADGRNYIRGPNGELIECDEFGRPIKGGKVAKVGKDGKPIFDNEGDGRRND